MVTRQFWNVHTAPQGLMNTGPALDEVRAAVYGDRLISDACAQTIASWWHDAAHPYTTRLSTGGHVDRYATIDDFCPESDWGTACDNQTDRDALRKLGEYLTHHQTNAPSAVRPCACHTCFDTVVGIAGELCSECADAGCDAQFAYECDRPAEDESDECPDDCTCIYCIPGC